MAALVLNKATMEETVKNGVTLVDFWAPWCGPCKVQLPIVEELAAELDGKAVLAKVNVDEQSELAGQYGITSIPTLMLFKDGELIESMVGLQSKTLLKEKILSLSGQ